MKNGARYIVTTRWGTFSLDEGAYQDYLMGDLWITWEPGKKRKERDRSERDTPPDISAKALELRDYADHFGVLQALASIGVQNAPPPYTDRLSDIPLDELNLTVRSSNGLKRAAAHTFGKINALILSEGGVKSVRNLGEKSAGEIHDIFFEECYLRLLPYEKAMYWENINMTYI